MERRENLDIVQTTFKARGCIIISQLKHCNRSPKAGRFPQLDALPPAGAKSACLSLHPPAGGWATGTSRPVALCRPGRTFRIPLSHVPHVVLSDLRHLCFPPVRAGLCPPNSHVAALTASFSESDGIGETAFKEVIQTS